MDNYRLKQKNTFFSLEKIGHIVWDYNGTLLNDLDVCVQVINRVLERRNLELLTKEGYQAVFDFPVRHYYEKIGFDFSKESFEIVGTEFIEEYNKEQSVCSLQDNAVDTLRVLYEMGIRQSVLSARLQQSLEDEINKFGINHYFTHIFGLDHHYADGKTERGKQLIKKINLPAEKIMMIGDTLHDFYVAQKLGINVILVANGHHSYNRLNAEGELVFHNLQELLDLILGIECYKMK